MTNRNPIYFALGFGSPGCLPDNAPNVYCVYTRTELMRSIQEQFSDSGEARNAMRALGIRNLWPHLVRHGASMVSRELPTGKGSEALMFIGITENEYVNASHEEDY